METVKERLFGTDAEVASVIPDVNDIPYLVPPVWLEKMEGAKVIGNYGDDTHPIYLENESGFWFRDGALWETAFPPVTEAKQMYDAFRKAKENLAEYLSKYNLEIFDKPVARFDISKYVHLAEADIREACVAGCDPDFDAIQTKYSCKTRDLTQWKYRSMGGHLHLSISTDYGKILHRKRNTLVRLLAILVGNAGVATAEAPELEKIRREQFGDAGRHRFPTYPDGKAGVEYRSLSVTWLNSLETIETVLDLADTALEIMLFNPELTRHLILTYLDSTVDCIREVDVEGSKNILKRIYKDI